MKSQILKGQNSKCVLKQFEVMLENILLSQEVRRKSCK